MKAYTIHKAYEGSVAEKQAPVPKEGEALVRVLYAGMCGSDIHSFEGKHVRRQLPLVPGHECSGVVEAVGSKEDQDLVGRFVAVHPEQGCGTCQSCANGWTNICRSKRLMGSGRWDGCFAEYITAPLSLIVPLPEGLSAKIGVLAEPLAVAVHAFKQANFKQGQSILIFGMGGIGALLLALGQYYGINKSIVCDVKEYNLHYAREHGATFALNTKEVQAPQQLEALSDVPDIDVSFVAASWPELINQSFALVRQKGTICLVGQFNSPGIVDVDKGRLKEQIITGSATYQIEDFRKAVELLGKAPEHFASVLTHFIELEEADSWLKRMAKADYEAIKVCVQFEQE